MDFRAVFFPALLLAASASAQGVSKPVEASGTTPDAVLATAVATKPIEPNGDARPANGNKVYRALREDMPASDGAVQVKGLVLERQGAKLSFDEGNFYFYAPVNGVVTGAVFVGKGRFELAPKQVSEQKSLALLTKAPSISQDLSTAVLRFTDGTADEIRKASTGAAPAPEAHVASDAENLEKGFHSSLNEDLDLRLLEDVIDARPGGFFLASFHVSGGIGGRNGLFIVDPHGTFHVAPDQVELTTWTDSELQPWVAYKMEHPDPAQQGVGVQVVDEKLDVTIDHSGAMKASAETTVKVRRDGLRVVRLNLYPALTVSGVFGEDGSPLQFVWKDGYDFAVILPKPAKAGEPVRFLTQYSGKDVVKDEGNDTYYLVPSARASWYPSGEGRLGDFANFHMTFHIPKQLQIVATGSETPRQPEAGGMVKSVWETTSPIPVAGFNLGDFKSDEAKTPAGFNVGAYSDVGLPSDLEALADIGDTLGGLSATQALKGEVSQGTAAIQIYTDYFGKLPYDHVALTEQPACFMGQSWPMLVYLPICGFWDKTVQQRLGLRDFDASYWSEVTPHEVSHQWWGQLVGFNSYRDQWMSEGFANFSVSLFLMHTSPNLDAYHAFWKEQQKDLLEKNTQGVRPIDVGPVTMGGRVSNSKTGNVYEMLVYSKGAYVLHMLEEQFWTVQEQDAPFKRAMQQFVKDYAGKAATTEDWKASMEKSMPKTMDLRGDGKLDWFFDEFVYGTELPHYATSSDFQVGGDGLTTAHFKITQSNVSNTFVMRVPVYLQLQDGQTKRLFNAVLHGDATLEQTVKLPMKLPSPAKAIVVNYNADVLSDN